MENPVYIFLEKVLTIIDYRDDKNLFIDKFLELAIQKTNQLLIDNLPDAVQKQLNENSHNAADFASLLSRHIPSDKYQQELASQISQQFEEYIETILPTLEREKKNTLLEFLSEQKIYNNK